MNAMKKKLYILKTKLYSFYTSDPAQDRCGTPLLVLSLSTREIWLERERIGIQVFLPWHPVILGSSGIDDKNLSRLRLKV